MADDYFAMAKKFVNDTRRQTITLLEQSKLETIQLIEGIYTQTKEQIEHITEITKDQLDKGTVKFEEAKNIIDVAIEVIGGFEQEMIDQLDNAWTYAKGKVESITKKASESVGVKEIKKMFAEILRGIEEQLETLRNQMHEYSLNAIEDLRQHFRRIYKESSSKKAHCEFKES